MSKLETQLVELNRRVQERVARGMDRERAMMLTVMELGGKITIVRG